MVSPKKWLSILSVNSLMFFNVSFPVLMLPNIVNGGEVIAQTDKSAEAEKILDEGMKLYKEGTAESLKGAIVLLNESQPELSGLVLSLYDEKGKETSEFLQLNDIFNLELPA